MFAHFSKGDAATLKKWWWFRFSITLMVISAVLGMLIIIGRLTTLWEVVFGGCIFYRIYELFLVHLWRKELA